MVTCHHISVTQTHLGPAGGFGQPEKTTLDGSESQNASCMEYLPGGKHLSHEAFGIEKKIIPTLLRRVIFRTLHLLDSTFAFWTISSIFESSRWRYVCRPHHSYLPFTIKTSSQNMVKYTIPTVDGSEILHHPIHTKKTCK